MNGRHVAAALQCALGVQEFRVGQHEGDGAEADDEGQHVEVADPGGGPQHGFAGFFGVGHGEEAHQDVGQTSGAEHQGHAEGDGADGVLHERAWAHDGEACLGGFFGRFACGHGQAGLDFNGLGKHGFGAETKVPQHHEGHERRTGQQQTGFDDLHPGGGGHAAEQHVHHHQRAHDHHSDVVLQAEQQLDQLACAHHLGDQVEGHHHERAGSGKHADGGLGKAEGSHVGKGELAQVAQTLGHQESDHRPAHQEADGVDEAVKTACHHGSGNTQERRGRHVVACNGQTVLETGDAATAGVEVGGRLGFGRCPLGDEHGAGHKGAEHDDGCPVGGLLFGLAEVSTCSQRARAGQHHAQKGEELG